VALIIVNKRVLVIVLLRFLPKQHSRWVWYKGNELFSYNSKN